VLVDTAKSFVYAEGSGISPNLTSRFTPGTLISPYEIYEALRRGVAVPFRKRDAEGIRNVSELRASDKGGMISSRSRRLTSLYPSIIVKYKPLA
jgi:DNA polymerase I